MDLQHPLFSKRFDIASKLGISTVLNIFKTFLQRTYGWNLAASRDKEGKNRICYLFHYDLLLMMSLILLLMMQVLVMVLSLFYQLKIEYNNWTVFSWKRIQTIRKINYLYCVII